MLESPIRRVYAETSVYGVMTPLHPPVFRGPSEQFFARVRQGMYRLVVSDHLRREIQHPRTPAEVKALFSEMEQLAEHMVTTAEAEILRDAYIAGGIFSLDTAADALHVALASVAGVDILASWDRGEIVKAKVVAGVHQVNQAAGYPLIDILLPRDL
jgi:predicted nucleic acid-binding protein